MIVMLLSLLLVLERVACFQPITINCHEYPRQNYFRFIQQQNSNENNKNPQHSSSILLFAETESSLSSSSNIERISKRKRFLNALHKRKSLSNHKESDQKDLITYNVSTKEELEDYFNDVNYNFSKKQENKNDDLQGDIDYDKLLKHLSVKGDTQRIGSPHEKDFVHSVQSVLHERRRTKSPLTPYDETRADGNKVALVIEGGGMRGCVTAGMVTAIYYLGLEDTFDVIYGSSAGTIIGAYFNTRQLPWFGPEVYYDSLTTAGKKFIDTKRLLRCIGVGLLDPRLIKDVVLRPRFGKPVLNLDFLLKETMQYRKPLDWEKFCEMQKVQPLKVVASGLNEGSSVILDMQNDGFSSIQELAYAMRGSCLLPGIAGPVVNVHKKKFRTKGAASKKKYIVKNNLKKYKEYEPMADALVYEPLPYRSAIKEGATHVVMLRSRPDGADVTGKTSVFEKLILHRFFRKKNKLKHIYKYMRQHGHKKLYSKQVIELNEASNDGSSSAQMMAIAVPPGSPEVARLETRRTEIFNGVRRGFARAYDALVEDPKERGRGEIVAKQYFPDEILDYEPLNIDSGPISAFEFFLNEKESNGEEISLPSTVGKTAYEANLPR